MTSNGFRKHQWWKEAVVYQVYPASFLDSNGDGWGDVNGITSKVDHLKDLGVDVVWSSPIMKSPQLDMGYDISDYYDIDPIYGTLEDVDRLIAELKKRDMKLMMDLVVNHTSSEHEWFKQSRSSLDNPKREWYIWKKAKYDAAGKRQPPNNWSMILGEANSAWNWDEKTQEYYLAIFSEGQPDLNWENPDVREAVHNVLRFWLDRGVCGFRMDVINLISKVQTFPDAPIQDPTNIYQPGHEFYANGPRLNEFLKAMNSEVLSKYDSMTVGEMPFVRDDKEILKVVGADQGELNQIFLFELVDIDNGDAFRMTLREFSPVEIKQIMNKQQRLMIDNDGWNSLFVENHDNQRSVSRYTSDSDADRELGSKLLCMMNTTLCGTIYVYQGQEIGTRNFPASWPVEEYKDVESLNYWHKMSSMYPNDKDQLDFAKKVMANKARDHSRTPVQWNANAHAGFCRSDVKPWMRVNDDYPTVNVEVQNKPTDANGKPHPGGMSVLAFWRRGLANRKRHKEAFVYGDFKVLDYDNPELFAYLRIAEETEEGTWMTVLNFSKKEVKWEIPSEVEVEMWCAGNYVADKPDKPLKGMITVQPWEGLLGMCKR